MDGETSASREDYYAAEDPSHSANGASGAHEYKAGRIDSWAEGDFLEEERGERGAPAEEKGEGGAQAPGGASLQLQAHKIKKSEVGDLKERVASIEEQIKKSAEEYDRLKEVIEKLKIVNSLLHEEVCREYKELEVSRERSDKE